MRILSLLLLFAASRALAVRPIEPPAPDFPAQAVWLNARDLSMERVRGKRVVLVAFLNTMNINSVRAAQALKAWDRRYSLDGLMVIGVHTPEFGFQKDPAALKDALRAMRIEFPVVLDNDKAIWKSYANDGWPAFYLVDYKGHIVFNRLGEGGYEETETAIRKEIERMTGSAPPGGAPAVLDPQPVGGQCGEMTAELNLGADGKDIIDLNLDESTNNLMIGESRDGEVAFRGRWAREAQDVRLEQKNSDLSGFIRVIYRGAQSWAILSGSDAGPAKVWLRQDDLWLDASNAGRDVRFDSEGRSYVTAGAPRFYELTNNPNDNAHELVLTPLGVGARVYGLSFSNACLKVK
jgi:hypothetical protein